MAHQRQFLTVAFAALGRMFPAALFERDGFLAFDLRHNLSLNAGAFNAGCANGWGAVAADHQNFVKLNSGAFFSSQFFDAQHVIG